MANLSELPQWDAGVYRLEATDPAEGGESGKANAPLKNLANRTSYLKQRVDSLELETSMADHVAASDPHPGYMTTAEDSAVMAAHVSASDPHPVYTTADELATAIAGVGGLGVGQTINNYTSSGRVAGTNYQNTTGKPIFITFACGAGATAGGNFYVGGNSNMTSNPVILFSDGGTYWNFVIPHGTYYGISAGAAINLWLETR